MAQASEPPLLQSQQCWLPTLQRAQGPPTWLLYLTVFRSGLEGQCQERCNLHHLPANPPQELFLTCTLASGLRSLCVPHASLNSPLCMNSPTTGPGTLILNIPTNSLQFSTASDCHPLSKAPLPSATPPRRVVGIHITPQP